MKDFTGLVLCDYCSERVDIHVWADLSEGKLTVSGQDVGPAAEEFWSDLDYEYWYSFDEEETAKLLKAIHGEEDPEEAFLREFNGESACRTLRAFCDENGIRYRFDSF